jgi:hypothetical protein
MRVRKDEGKVTPEEIYDWLAAQGVKDPAVVALGDRHVVGRWENVSNFLPNGYVCRAGNLAIVVLGEADNWIDAHAKAKARLSA